MPKPSTTPTWATDASARTAIPTGFATTGWPLTGATDGVVFDGGIDNQWRYEVDLWVDFIEPFFVTDGEMTITDLNAETITGIDTGANALVIQTDTGTTTGDLFVQNLNGGDAVLQTSTGIARVRSTGGDVLIDAIAAGTDVRIQVTTGAATGRITLDRDTGDISTVGADYTVDVSGLMDLDAVGQRGASMDARPTGEGVIPVVFDFVFTGDGTSQAYSESVPYEFYILDAWVIATAGSGTAGDNITVNAGPGSDLADIDLSSATAGDIIRAESDTSGGRPGTTVAGGTIGGLFRQATGFNTVLYVMIARK